MGVLVDIVPNHVGVATPARERVVVGRAAARPGLGARRRRSTSTGTPAAAGCGSRWSATTTCGADGRIAHLDGRRRRAALPRPPLPARARHATTALSGSDADDGARPPALRAGQLARGRRRPQLPPVLRGQHPGRRSGSRTRAVFDGLARRDPALVRRGPRRRAAGRPPRRPARPRGATSTTWPS